MSDEVKVQTKGFNKKFIFIAITIIVVGLIAAVVFVPKSAKAKKVEEQLNLGAKYLSELDYEQAIVAYEAVIKIDPKCEEAYLALADVYIATGEFEKAEEVLKKAEEALGGTTPAIEIKKSEVSTEKILKESIQETTPILTPSPTNTPTPTPAEMEEQYILPDKSLGEIIYQGMASDSVISWDEIEFIEDPLLQTCLEWKEASIDEICESLISSGVPERTLENTLQRGIENGEQVDDWYTYTLYGHSISDAVRLLRAQFRNDTDRLEVVDLKYVQDEKIVKLRDVKIGETIETVFQKLGFENSLEIAKFSNKLSEVKMEDTYRYLFDSHGEDETEKGLRIYPISCSAGESGCVNGIGIQFSRGVLTGKELAEMSVLDKAALSQIELWFDYNVEEKTFKLSSYEILVDYYLVD